MNETTNKYDNPILICIGSHKDFHDDGELFCGGCGYQYSSDEAEAMFKDVKIKVADTCGMEVHTKPLRCIRCCREYKSVYFSELGEVSKIVPPSLFKNRYVTKYGELFLPKKFEAPLFIPSWDVNKQRRMSYADAIAYMLYSSLAPLGYTSSDAELRVRSEYWELFSSVRQSLRIFTMIFAVFRRNLYTVVLMNSIILWKACVTWNTIVSFR